MATNLCSLNVKYTESIQRRLVKINVLFVSVHNMAGHWFYGDVPSERDNGFRMPFRSKWDQAQNQGRAPGIKTRFTFDRLDAADECASQSWGPVQPILPPVPPRQAVRRVKPKEKCLSWRDLEEDEGYFSPFNKDFNAWNKPSRCVFSGSSSSPLLAHKTCFRPGSSESGSHGQTSPSHQDEFLADNGQIVSGSILQPLNADVGSLDDDRSDTGLPVLQSSMCGSVRVELNCGREQKRQVSVEVQEHMLETVNGGWTTLVEQDSILDTSYETTFRLHVKVTCNFQFLQITVHSIVFRCNSCIIEGKICRLGS